MGLRIHPVVLVIALILAFGLTVSAQTTEFTYQGSLSDNLQAANGNYDFEFALFDAVSAGTQFGPTITRSNVSVVNGVFSLGLDFGSQFPGGPRFLRIGVKTAGGGSFTVLSPRQQVTSIPYAIRSISASTATTATSATTAATATNSNQLGGIAASQYVLTGDSRLSDARLPLPGSGNYIRNSAVQQPGTHFNISGTGFADKFVASSRYQIGSETVLSVPGTGNVFTGKGAGFANTASNNSFFGDNAGTSNMEGTGNSFFGSRSGFDNNGSWNSFFGDNAGVSNTSGTQNSYFGADAGRGNLTGDNNTLVGFRAGEGIVTGRWNTVVGADAALASPAGDKNAIFGNDAGSNNEGDGNAFFGFASGFQTNSGFANSFFGVNSGNFNRTGSNNTTLGADSDVGASDLTYATAIGAGATVISSNTVQLGRRTAEDAVVVSGTLRIGNLGSAGSTTLCRNASFEIATCSSSLRYKTNVNNFLPGLDLVRKLRPVSFKWIGSIERDIGLIAEEVARAEPLLVTTKNGRVEGVKYDRVAVLLVNAVSEQQIQIELERKKVNQQSEEIDALRDRVRKQTEMIDAQGIALKKLEAELGMLKERVCASKPEAQACKN